MKPFHSNRKEGLRRQLPTSFEAGLNRLSPDLFLPRPWNPRRTWTPDPRSLEIRGKWRFSAEIAFSSELCCLLAHLVASQALRSGLMDSPQGLAHVSARRSHLLDLRPYSQRATSSSFRRVERKNTPLNSRHTGNSDLLYSLHNKKTKAVFYLQKTHKIPKRSKQITF